MPLYSTECVAYDNVTHAYYALLHYTLICCSINLQIILPIHPQQPNSHLLSIVVARVKLELAE